MGEWPLLKNNKSGGKVAIQSQTIDFKRGERILDTKNRAADKSVTIQLAVQLPLSLSNARKRDMRSQFAALVWRVRNGKTQILLITSRGTGRWIIPKGWPMLGMIPAEAAAQEAWEEAGVKGKVSSQCLGVYSYLKRNEEKRDLPCLAMVYPVKCKKLETEFPEAGQRRRKWYSQKKAAKLVKEPELAKIIKSFDPSRLQ